MGVIAGVGIREESIANGYLRGQVWNRPVIPSEQYLCFRLWHPWGSTSRYHAAGSAAEDEAFIEPGHYTDADSLNGLTLSWQRQIAEIYSPYFSYQADPLYSSLFLPGRADKWMGEASIIRAHGYDSLPSGNYLAGNLGDIFEWSASTTLRTQSAVGNFYGYLGKDKTTDLFMRVPSTQRYYVIEFSAEVNYDNILTSSQGTPTITCEIGSMSASLVKDKQTPTQDFYPPNSIRELAGWGEARTPASAYLDRVDHSGFFADSDRYIVAQVFVYDSVAETGTWLQQNTFNFLGF